MHTLGKNKNNTWVVTVNCLELSSGISFGFYVLGFFPFCCLSLIMDSGTFFLSRGLVFPFKYQEK